MVVILAFGKAVAGGLLGIRGQPGLYNGKFRTAWITQRDPTSNKQTRKAERGNKALKSGFTTISKKHYQIWEIMSHFTILGF